MEYFGKLFTYLTCASAQLQSSKSWCFWQTRIINFDSSYAWFSDAVFLYNFLGSLVVAPAAIVLTLLVSSVKCTITCYQCHGYSGETGATTSGSNCGLPFNDSTTSPTSGLTRVTCNGICVTQAIYTGSKFINDCSFSHSYFSAEEY